jgi:hypothetical protein
MGKTMVCDRCKKSTLGKGFVRHQRHRDDPEDYSHTLCHECNLAYEQERNQWQETHPLDLAEGMSRAQRSVVIEKWAEACHNHMRDWLVATR